MNMYFCNKCGTRLWHQRDGKELISVKGGCIEGLDWSRAIHIWTSEAVVPIPEGVERFEKEPDD